MPHAEPRTAGNDALDDLFNYDDSLDEVFNAKSNSGTTSSGVDGQRRRGDDLRKDLDVDDEIIITKKRKPIAKLDDARLLSANGITKLRNTAKNKLRFRGKGHEYSDMQKLLSMYQLWLDDLYPRAKFADGLAIIEKLGHSKRIQIMRKAWIDEGKPKRADSPDNDFADTGDDKPDEQAANGAPQHEELEDDIFASLVREAELEDQDEGRQRRQTTATGETEQPDEDELDALFAAGSRSNGDVSHSIFGNSKPQSSEQASVTKQAQDDMFASEMEAMQEMEGMW